MNNGKVRIYDLSKELNLDNKDILDICAQLNIAVKSHSSTITESQAERIRIAAERYTPSHQPALKGHGPHAADGGADTLSLPSTEATKGQHKQQILAIKHHRPSPLLGATLTQQPAALDLTPPPPRPPVKPQPPSPPKLAPISHPAEPSASLKQPLSRPALESSPQPHPGGEEVALAAKPGSEPPPLLEPPLRAKEEPAEVKTERRQAPKPAKKAESLSAAAPPKRAAEGEKLMVEPAAKKQREEKVLPKLQARPHRLKSAQETKSVLVESPASEEPEVEVEELEDLLGETPGKPKAPKLKQRPTPLRPEKQGTWEGEEEEIQDNKGKASKTTTKGKRKAQLLIDEEDEDLESALEGLSTPSYVSISVARPPKPKSAVRPPALVPSGAKATQKPMPKAESTPKEGRQEKPEVMKPPETVVLPESLTVRQLADLLRIPETEIIKKLFFKGLAVNVTQTLDLDTARLVSEELGVKVETVQETSAAAKTTEMLDIEDLENLQRRPPVVTIMGHVDHGKTTLLDSIRQTKVAQGEAGGITQHIGAYHVDIEHDGKQQQIVFLDTPGHEAFTAMRARGARVTDIAVLVVAADDGVQPQTKEAISHAKAAEVPIVVAINKMDKPDANPDRVKQELAELGLVPEEWGGETIMVPVSALKGENLDTLLEMILLVAEVAELSANPNRSAKGTVIEANLDRTRGPVATLLVQNGTLRVGDIILAGSVFGKIRAMIGDRGNKVEVATPSFAVEILGLNDVPAPGDEFEVFEHEKEARAIAEQRADTQRHSRLQQAMSSRRVTLSSFSEQAREGQLKELNLILKADVQGSLEAILNALKQLPQQEVQLRVLLAAPGEITETDVDLAAASGAVIVGFNTTLASGARHAADREGVDIREYNIIYKLLDEIQGAMEGLLEPEEVEEPLGTTEVRAVFQVGRGAVAGCYVLSGKVVRNRPIRVRRGGEVIYQGNLDSLKRIKEDAREVNAGYECGIGVAKFNDWKEGDLIESYQMVMKRRTLSTH